MVDRRSHWDTMYRTGDETALSWFQPAPSLSLDLIGQRCTAPGGAIIDVGGGASRLAGALIAAGYRDITVIDLAEAALATARARIGEAAARITWIAGDITRWTPDRTYNLWHDRATFHFLIEPDDRARYVACLTAGLAPGAHAIIATFAADGPQRCSNLPVQRYDAAGLAAALGRAFQLVDARLEQHRTPSGSEQKFQFAIFRRVVSPARAA